jgi:hypothetical protein
MSSPHIPALDLIAGRKLSISAVLPAYNEEALIERTVRRVAPASG